MGSKKAWASKFKLLKRDVKENPLILLNPATVVQAGLCVAVPASAPISRGCRKLLSSHSRKASLDNTPPSPRASTPRLSPATPNSPQSPSFQNVDLQSSTSSWSTSDSSLVVQHPITLTVEEHCSQRGTTCSSLLPALALCFTAVGLHCLGLLVLCLLAIWLGFVLKLGFSLQTAGSGQSQTAQHSTALPTARHQSTGMAAMAHHSTTLSTAHLIR